MTGEDLNKETLMKHGCVIFDKPSTATLKQGPAPKPSTQPSAMFADWQRGVKCHTNRGNH